MAKRIRSDNRGLTLLELLIGVVILAIIVVPLLHTFVIGASTEYKTRKLAEDTDAAQNLCEQIQAQDADLILSNSAAVSASAQYYTKNGDGTFSRFATTSGSGTFYTKAPIYSDVSKTYYIGIPGYTYGNSQYDALITLDVPADSANTQEVIVGNQMDALLNMSDADKTALDQLIAECGDLVSNISELNPEDLTRTISLNISKSADPNELNTYIVTAYFQYAADITYLDAKKNSLIKHFAYVEQSSATVRSVTEKADGSPAFSIFMFYDAYYKNAAISDSIIINKTDGPDANVFIVNTDKSVFTNAYKATVWYKYQKFTGTGSASMPVNRLIITNLQGTQIEYGAWRDAIYKKTQTPSSYLVETKARSRKFNVKVELFQAGSGFTGTPTTTMDSTKLSY